MMSAAEGVLSETYRGVAAAWECDVMGHLTIAFYFDRFSDAAFSLIERLAPAKAPPAAAWRSTELLVRYQKELRAGDGLFIRSGIIGRDGEAIRVAHELARPDTREVCTLVEHTLMPRDLPYGGHVEQRRLLAEAVVPWTTPGFADFAPPTRRERMIDSGRDRVKAWELDERGELSLSGFVHRFAHACLHMCSAFGMTADYMRAEKRGFSTFETRLALVAPPPGAGDALLVRSGLIKAGNSSLHMLHELSYARNGERLAVFHQSGVHFDLEARGSAPLPPALRDRANSLLIA
jgi:acyl-CoA thioester hydrolase